MQFNSVDFVVVLACSKTNFCVDYFLISVRWLISIEEEPFHGSKFNLFTYSLNDNKAKSRVIKITLVCVDVIYSHVRISVNCLNHFD